jgi:lysozyme family protein
MTKQSVIDEIIRVEGGYVNDPSDSGGATNFGITEKVARAWGFKGAMRNLPREMAFDIYAARYWDKVLADDMPDRVAEEVVDTAVNMGAGRAGKFLQRALNVLNNGGKSHPDIAVDGAIGSRTIRALNAYLAKRDEQTLVKALNCLQGAYYIELAERREKDQRFVYGWLKNRVVL